MASSPAALARNLRLLCTSAALHLVDDPALLVIQVSRRLPITVRTRAGHLLERGALRLGRLSGLAALGSHMAGRDERAVEILESSGTGRLSGEVAVLLDRPDLLGEHSASSTRARAAWNTGDLRGAVDLLERDGAGRGLQARRLRSELALLDPRSMLAAPRAVRGPRARHPRGRSSPQTDGELRVLHILTNSLPHTQSGYSLRSHRILTALRDQGIRSVALTRTGYPVMVGKLGAADRDLVDGIEYRRCLPARLGFSPRARLEREVAAALRIVQEFGPQVLHATSDHRNALVAEAVSRATGIPWVYEVRGFAEQTWVASHATEADRDRAARSQRARLVAVREGELAQRAAAVVTLSATMAEELHRRGVMPERITIVPNGIEESLLERESTTVEARARLGLTDLEGTLVVGAVSALVGYEGFDILLRAVARLLADPGTPADLRDRLHVVIAGDGTAAPALGELAGELGIGDRTHFPGRVDRREAPAWVQAMDVVVVPRRDRAVSRSVTPQKPVEAMALGRPVIVSDLPALREAVDDECGAPCAVLVPADSPEHLAAALLDVLTDPGRQVELARRGRDVAARRAWPILVRRHVRVYSACIRSAEGDDA